MDSNFRFRVFRAARGGAREEVKFAADSLLEEGGFELPVPRSDVVILRTGASVEWGALLLALQEAVHSDIDQLA
jgi:hypothetical protein